MTRRGRLQVQTVCHAAEQQRGTHPRCGGGWLVSRSNERWGGLSQVAPILVVDDDFWVRTVMCEALALTGFPIMAADHGGIALDLVQREQVALIFLDMKMPVMDGWAFVREYRTRVMSPAPIVTMSAARDAPAWAAEVNANAFLVKPFELDELLMLVARFAVVPVSATALR
jgi:CheY-like chemotaxis protein